MSSATGGPGLAIDAAAGRVLRLYEAAAALSLAGIAVLAVYSIRLGSLVGPGVESSFGLAVGLMFLLGALVVHLIDRTYREFPLGRRIGAPNPGAVSDAALALFLKALTVAIAAGAISYILWGVLGG